MTWNHALETFCELYEKSDTACRWIIVGSAASVLQGADMTPNDLDIYVRDIDDVARIARFMKPFGLKSKSELSHFDANWLSSDEEPFMTQSFSSGFTWSKGKWKFGHFGVEVVQISNSAGIPDSDSGDGIWEGGSYIWELAKHVPFAGRTVPVVPLEIQLESNLRRKRQDRADAITKALLTLGYNKKLLMRALSRDHFEQFKLLFQ